MSSPLSYVRRFPLGFVLVVGAIVLTVGLAIAWFSFEDEEVPVCKRFNAQLELCVPKHSVAYNQSTQIILSIDGIGRGAKIKFRQSKQSNLYAVTILGHPYGIHNDHNFAKEKYKIWSGVPEIDSLIDESAVRKLYDIYERPRSREQSLELVLYEKNDAHSPIYCHWLRTAQTGYCETRIEKSNFLMVRFPPELLFDWKQVLSFLRGHLVESSHNAQ